MKKYKEGTQFIVCGVKYLVDTLGWHVEDEGYYYHEDFPNLSISPLMLKYAGKTLTIRKMHFFGSDWYAVEENMHYWPVASFLGAKIIDFSHTCEEGMTPIDGWFICKTCGDDLREIKC